MSCLNCILFNEFQDHLRSERHYLEFVETAKRQYKRQVEEEKLAEESKKRKTDDSSEESSKKVKTEVVDDENDQGNGKCRVVSI